MENNALISFENNRIRKEWHDEQWFFSVVDVIAVLTDSVKPRDYWSVLKKREPQLPTNCRQLKLKSSDGKNYLHLKEKVKSRNCHRVSDPLSIFE